MPEQKKPDFAQFQAAQKHHLAMETEARKFFPTWQPIYQYIDPLRGSFDDAQPDKARVIDHSLIMDGHPKRCCRDSTNGMMHAIISESRPWFKWGIDDDPDLEEWGEVARWLEEVTRIQLAVYSRTNIYECFYSFLKEYLMSSTPCIYLNEDFNDRLRAYTFTCGEYALDQDAACRINAFARSFWMTTAQLVGFYGINQVPGNVKAQYENGDYYKWHQVKLLIEPNGKADSRYVTSDRMAFSAFHWLTGQSEFMRVGGYEEFPNFAARWEKSRTSDIYSQGAPGWDALGHIKQLYAEITDKLIVIDKLADPPLQADASVSGAVNNLPGGLTRTSAMVPNAGVRPLYQVDPHIEPLRLDIETVKQEIAADFYTPLFRMFMELERGGVTATEIAEKQSEKVAQLTPFAERLNLDTLIPFNVTAFRYLVKQGAFPEPPKELRGKTVNPKCISALAMTQKLLQLGPVVDTVDFGMRVGAAVPEAMLNIDFGEAVRSYASFRGAPVKMINSPEKVAAMKAQIEKDAANAKAQAGLMAAAEAAAKGAKATKDMATAPVGAGSALDGIMAGFQGMGGK